MQNLKYLLLNNNKIKLIEAELFYDANRLLELNLESNLLTLINFNNIGNMLYLNALNVRKNPVKKIDPNLKITISTIQNLQLDNSDEKCDLTVFYRKNQYMPILLQQFFETMSNLLIVHMKYNQIETIASNSFTNLTNLNYLYLSFNRLKQINENSFKGLFNLKSLLLDNNLIESIEFS